MPEDGEIRILDGKRQRYESGLGWVDDEKYPTGEPDQPIVVITPVPDDDNR